MGMRLWTDQTFKVVFLILTWKGAGRWRRERWPAKIDLNRGKHCYCCWFGQKWLSNHIKNDSRIFEHSQDCSSLDSERGFGKEKVGCTFCCTLLDTWAKWRPSHILPRHYRNGRRRQFFNSIITGNETWCSAYDREIKRQFWMGWWGMRHALGRRNWNS